MFWLVLRELLVLVIWGVIAYALYKLIKKTKRNDNISAAKNNIDSTLEDDRNLPKYDKNKLEKATENIKRFLKIGKE